MANTKNFIAKNGVSTGDGYAMPDVRPSLLLDFANSKTLDPRITFTRGSTATYWDGKTTTKAEENLTKYSQDYSQSDWSKFYLALTDDATTAPDGTTTAASLIATTANNNHYIAFAYADLSNKQVTQSWFAKANGYNHCFVGHGIGPTEGAWFNLSTGATGTVGSAVTSSSITSVGNGWYRCSITYTRSQTVRYAIIAPTNADGTVFFTGDGTSGIYAWGAQVEQRSSATAYTPTTSSPIVKYQPVLQTAASGEARFDHDPVTGESKGLLIEESRTNLRTNSVLFSTNNLQNARMIGNSGIAPDGTHTASQYWNDGNTLGYNYSTFHNVLQSGTTYTFSWFAKHIYGDAEVYLACGGNITFWIKMNPDGSIHSYNAAGGADYVNSGSEAVGNGWHRVWITITATTAGTYQELQVDFPTGNYNSWLVWGLQVETGTFPTSYIPTSGSTVTRSSDLAEMTGTNFSSWYSHNEGSLCVEAATADVSLLSEFNISDGTSNNRIMFAFRTAASRAPFLQNFGTAIGSIANNTGLANNVFSTMAIALKDNDIASSLDGQSVQTLSAALPKLVDSFQIGSTASGATNNALHIKKFAFYPKRLPNATLQQMTEE